MIIPEETQYSKDKSNKGFRIIKNHVYSQLEGFQPISYIYSIHIPCYILPLAPAENWKTATHREHCIFVLKRTEQNKLQIRTLHDLNLNCWAQRLDLCEF